MAAAVTVLVAVMVVALGVALVVVVVVVMVDATETETTGSTDVTAVTPEEAFSVAGVSFIMLNFFWSKSGSREPKLLVSSLPSSMSRRLEGPADHSPVVVVGDRLPGLRGLPDPLPKPTEARAGPRGRGAYCGADSRCITEGKAGLAEVLRLPVEEKGSEYMNGLMTGPPIVDVRPLEPAFVLQTPVAEMDRAELGVVAVLGRRRCSVLAERRKSYIWSTGTMAFVDGSEEADVEDSSAL